MSSISSQLPTLDQIGLISDPNSSYEDIYNIAKDSKSIDTLLFLLMRRKEDLPIISIAAENILSNPHFSSVMILSMEQYLNLDEPSVQKALLSNDKTPLSVIGRLAESDFASEETLKILKDHAVENVRTLARKNIAELTTSELVKRKLSERPHSKFEYSLIFNNPKIPQRVALEVAKMVETPVDVLKDLAIHENLKIRNTAFATLEEATAQIARGELGLNIEKHIIPSNIEESSPDEPSIQSTLK